MRSFFATLAMALVITGSAQAQTAIDVVKLNGLVDKIMQEVLQDSRKEPNPLFEVLKLQVDEKDTDLSSNDHLKLSLTATAAINRSHWSTAPTFVSLTLAGSADRNTQLAEANLKLGLRTDVVRLVNFLAKTAESDLCATPKIPDPADTQGNTAKACLEVKTLETVTTVRSFAQSLLRLTQVAHAYNNEKIAYLEKEIQTGDPKQMPYRRMALVGARSDEKIVERLESEWTTALKNSSGESFDLHVDALDLENWGALKDLAIHIDAKEVQIGLHFTSRRLRDIDSNFELKGIAEEYLVGLQTGDKKTVESVREVAKFYLSFVRGLLAP